MRGETADSTVDYVSNKLPGYLEEQVAVAADLASKAQDAAADIQKNKILFVAMAAMTPVSYTHLTLPTNREV